MDKILKVGRETRAKKARQTADTVGHVVSLGGAGRNLTCLKVSESDIHT